MVQGLTPTRSPWTPSYNLADEYIPNPILHFGKLLLVPFSVPNSPIVSIETESSSEFPRHFYSANVQSLLRHRSVFSSANISTLLLRANRASWAALSS